MWAGFSTRKRVLWDLWGSSSEVSKLGLGRFVGSPALEFRGRASVCIDAMLAQLRHTR